MEIRNISHELKNHQQTSDMDFISVMNYFLQTIVKRIVISFHLKMMTTLIGIKFQRKLKLIFRIIQRLPITLLNMLNR